MRASRLMKKYLQFFRIGLRKGIIYRSDAIAAVGTTIFYLILMFYIWRAISISGELSSPFSAIIAYIALGQVVSNATSVNLEVWFTERVREGTIVNELKRPVSLHLQVYFYQLGYSAFNIIGRSVPAFIVGLMFLGIGIPSTLNGLAFLLSVFLSLNLVVALSYFVSMAIFWTKVGWSLRMMRSTLSRLLSGVMFPLYLLPEWLKPIFYSTPFPWMIDGPIRIYQGAAGSEIVKVLCIQVFWTLVLVIISALIWRKAKKKITVQGG